MQGLIVAFIIISFIYKAYKNFTKESEKATQRSKEAEEMQKAAQRAQASEQTQNVRYQKAIEQPFVQTTYDKAVAQEYAPQPVFESHKEDYRKERAKRKEVRDAKSMVKRPVLDYYNPEVPAQEVVEGRRIHQPHGHAFKFPNKNEKHPLEDFSFKQAVIYDAIFRRSEY